MISIGRCMFVFSKGYKIHFFLYNCDYQRQSKSQLPLRKKRKNISVFSYLLCKSLSTIQWVCHERLARVRNGGKSKTVTCKGVLHASMQLNNSVKAKD